MRFNKPMSRNVQKGMREVQKCWRGSNICNITRELSFKWCAATIKTEAGYKSSTTEFHLPLVVRKSIQIGKRHNNPPNNLCPVPTPYLYV
jgi:hypothetical protein